MFPIFVPPLRDRREDIAFLVRHFAARFAAENGIRNVPEASAETLRLLEAHDWPGNIRQLENAVFRAVVLCETGVLTPEEFPQIRAQVSGVVVTGAAPAAQEVEAGANPLPAPSAVQPATANPVSVRGALRALDERGQVRTMAEIEEEMIRFAIEHYRGQMSQVARKLGIGRSTLYRKLKEYGIDHADPGVDASDA